MTVAVLSLKDTATLATPATASRLPLTIEGQAAQSMLLTAKVIVLSAAIAAGGAMMPTANTAWATSLFMGKFSVHELRKSGAMKSRPSAATTRIVARMRLVLTMRFGSGRAQALPSGQARVEDR